MLQPTIHTYRNASPTGMGFDASVYADEMPIRGRNPLAGLSSIGDAPTTSQLESLAATGASATVGILTAIGTVGGPVGAAISAGIGVALAVAQFFKGCGQTCIITSDDANKLEPYLQQNLQAYLSSPIRTVSMQQAALNNFDTIWNTLQQACSNPQYGAAGQRCVTDRQSGACTWKASASGWVKNADGTCTYTPAGPAGSGTACWNWFVGYRDPIASDPCVVPDSALQALVPSSSAAGAGISTQSPTGASSPPAANPFSSIPAPVLIGLAALGVLLFSMGGKD